MKKEQVPMTASEKQRQIRKEALATAILFVICFVWHVGFGFGFNGCGIEWLGLPLWWWLSTPGLFVVGVVGVLILLTKVFRNFDLGEETEEDE